MNILWHNGTFKDEGSPILMANDRALRGDGVFDTALAIDKRIAHGIAHFERLIANAKLFKITIKPSAKDLSEAALELLQENEFTKGRYAINSTITRGAGIRGLSITTSFQPNIIIRALQLPDEFPPVRAAIAKCTRRNEGSPLSQIKSLNYGDNILALHEAEQTGANEAIMLNNAGNIACATIGNIFIAHKGALYTPPLSDGAMAGITRGLLISHHGAQEKTLTPKDLQSADGVYISNSIRGLTPIASLDGVDLASHILDTPKDFHE